MLEKDGGEMVGTAKVHFVVDLVLHREHDLIGSADAMCDLPRIPVLFNGSHPDNERADCSPRG